MITILKILFYVSLFIALLALGEFLYTGEEDTLSAFIGLLIFSSFFWFPYFFLHKKEKLKNKLKIKDLRLKEIKCPACSWKLKIKNLDKKNIKCDYCGTNILIYN